MQSIAALHNKLSAHNIKQWAFIVSTEKAVTSFGTRIANAPICTRLNIDTKETLLEWILLIPCRHVATSSILEFDIAENLTL